MIFLISSAIILNIIAVLIPKNMTWNEIYSTSLFALVLAQTADVILDLKYDLYGLLIR